MIVESIFEWLFCNSKVNFVIVVRLGWSCFSLGNYILRETFVHQNYEIKHECNCRNKKYCSLGGKCLSLNIVYQGKITSSQPNYNDKVYFGVAERSFKDRFYNHTKSFTHEHYANDTRQLKKYWDIKRSTFIPKVSWSVLRMSTI